MTTLTVAIPFYRNVGYLRTAAASVLDQSTPKWRLLLIDDSGDPDAGEAVRALVAEIDDERVRACHNRGNLGMVASWNRCIDESETELVTLLHGDDRLRPGYVELALRLAEEHPTAVGLYCEAAIIGASGRPVFSLADGVKRFFAPRGARGAAGGLTILSGESAATALMAGNFIICPTLCFRKAVLGARRFESGWAQVQDLELTTRLLMDGETLVGSDDTAYEYRRHGDSATTLQSSSKLRFEEEFRLFDQVAQRADELGWETTAAVARDKRIVKLHLLYRSFRDLLALRPRQTLETLRYLRSKW